MSKLMSILVVAILMVTLGFLLAGCKGEQPIEKKGKLPETGSMEKPSYTPPKDGKITPEQADAYVKTCIGLIGNMKEQSKALESFREKYGLNEDLNELSDSIFIKDHPDIMKKWRELSDSWEGKEQGAYKNAGISEEEFVWIGGALDDTVNSEIQNEIANRLSEVMHK